MNTVPSAGLSGKVLDRRYSPLSEMILIYICDVCKKEIPKTNHQSIIIDKKRFCLCGKHYAQWRKYSKFLDASPKTVFDLNEFSIEGDTIKVFTNKENGSYFLIDLEDLDRVIVKKWRLWKNRVFTGSRMIISITDFLFPEKKENEVVDHINQNPLDNRKSNLRITTQKTNTRNRSIMGNNKSGVCGVWYDLKRNKWAAEIKNDYVKCFLGRYNDFNDACYARFIAEQIVFNDDRSFTNDHILIPAADQSTNKQKIKQYVTNKILNRFPNAN